MIGAFVDYDFSDISTEVRLFDEKAEIDLDHVVLAACRAVDRAAIEYPAVRAGVALTESWAMTPGSSVSARPSHS